ILGSFEARAADIAALRGQTAAQRRTARAEVGGWRRDRQASLQQQRTALREMRSTLASRERHRHSQGRAGLAELASTRADASRQQRDQRVQAHAHYAQLEAKRSQAARARLRELASDRHRARETWRSLTAALGARRRRAVAARGSPPPVGNTTPRESAPLPNGGEGTLPPSQLRSNLFDYLAGHPDGTRLTELEKVFGTSRIQAARLLRSLVDEGKAEKRDLLYFAI
ncbi:MAG: hypothetical protein HYX99_01875, partial [Chloroflexi bacterium]|nr:hypothetical protein [Chloroflexota bacterium]